MASGLAGGVAREATRARRTAPGARSSARLCTSEAVEALASGLLLLRRQGEHGMTPRPLLTLALAGLALAGCAGPEGAPPPSGRGAGKGDRIGPADDPDLLVEGASFPLADHLPA